MSMRDSDKKAEILISAAFIFAANVGLSFPRFENEDCETAGCVTFGKCLLS